MDDLPDKDENERAWLSAVGYSCLAYRHPQLSHWCGYVGLPEGHTAHGKDYDSIDVAVHGGLTYARGTAPNSRKPDGLWWIGFDCAHSGDLCPGVRRAISMVRSRGADMPDTEWPEEYRDINFVVAECESLAKQASEL